MIKYLKFNELPAGLLVNFTWQPSATGLRRLTNHKPFPTPRLL